MNDGEAMSASRRFQLVLACGLLTPLIPLLAQKEQRQPLTEVQIDQIREAGIYPDDRIKLYTKFLDEHVETIKGLTPRGHSSARTKRVDNELQDLTALMDELGSNLDQYGERKADLRKSLKPLTESTQRWLGVLNALPSEPGFDLSRKEAIDSGKDLADQADQLLKEQTDYFNAHKDEKGQDRAEPQ
jgi:hypothetical protein